MKLLMQVAAVVGLLLPLPTGSQSAAAAAPMERSANEVAAAAVERFYAAQEEESHYAYVEEGESFSYSSSGQQNSHRTHHSDIVMVDGLQQVRAKELDGKLVAPEEVAKQNARYHDDRTAHPTQKTDTVARVGYLPRLLATAFANRVTGHEVVDGRDCVVLDSTLRLEFADPEADRRIRLWVDAQSLDVLRYRFEYKDAERDMDLEAMTYFTVINGFPLTAKVEMSIAGPHGSHSTNVATHSRYQRLTTSTTITPSAP